jgi:phosphonoacetaldehyde hydrolase
MQMITAQSPYFGPLKGAILDWAGTAVDYGCLGPVAVFVDVFKSFHVAASIDEARQFMGLMKKDHIRGMLNLPGIRQRWEAAHNKAPDESDVEALYRKTEPMMVSAISRHGELIPGLLDTVAEMRRQGMKIGSCTGYTAPMMAALVPLAKRQGYEPDVVKCSSDAPRGRPYPWMCYLNAIEMDVYPMAALVKIGDTVSDIQEGLNAGMWTIGLTQSGNELGLTRDAAEALPKAELNRKLTDIDNRFRDVGAHYTAKGIWECLTIIDDINRKMARGEGPFDCHEGTP